MRAPGGPSPTFRSDSNVRGLILRYAAASLVVMTSSVMMLIDPPGGYLRSVAAGWYQNAVRTRKCPCEHTRRCSIRPRMELARRNGWLAEAGDGHRRRGVLAVGQTCARTPAAGVRAWRASRPAESVSVWGFSVRTTRLTRLW